MGKYIKLQLHRGDFYIDKLREYKVFVGDEFFGLIANDSTLLLENIPKDSTIQVKIDWCTSNKYKISTEDKEVELYVEPTFKGWRLSLWFMYVTLFRNQYLRIFCKE